MIQLKNIPKKFYAREFLMEFYSEFGIIIKVNLLNDTSSSAIVKFLNQENATKALEYGKILGDGEDPVEVEYYHESVSAKFMEKQAPVQQGTPKKVNNDCVLCYFEFVVPYLDLVHFRFFVWCFSNLCVGKCYV